jgi:hypothetical protein
MGKESKSFVVARKENHQVECAPEASVFVEEVSDAVMPVIKKWMQDGYNVIEIEHFVNQGVNCALTRIVLGIDEIKKTDSDEINETGAD